MVDGKFSVERGSNFSLAIYKELELTTAEGNKIWKDIFSIAQEEQFGDINKVKAGQEFELSETSLNKLKGIIKNKLKKDITIDKKGDTPPPNNDTPVSEEPRTIEEINKVTQLYEQAESAIKTLKNLNVQSPFFQNSLTLFKNSISKDNLAYILQEEPQFFEILENKIGEETSSEILNELVNKLGIKPTPYSNDASLTKEKCLELLNKFVEQNPAQPKVTNEERMERANINAEAERQEKITTDKRSLHVTLPKVGTKESLVNQNKTLAARNKDRIKQTPRDALSLSKDVLAYLLTEDLSVQNAVLDNLSASQLRTLLTKLIGDDAAQKVDKDDLDNEIKKACKNIVDKNQKAIEAERAAKPKAQQLVNDATNVLAELKNLPADKRKKVQTKDGGYIIYDTETGKGVKFNTQKNSTEIISLEVVQYNAEKKNYNTQTKFEQGKISCNIDPKYCDYEWSTNTTYDFNKIKNSAKDITAQ